MDEAKELKQAFDIFTAAWQIYKAHYPPQSPQDENYWSELTDEAERMAGKYDSRLCQDILCCVVADLERKAKYRYDSRRK